MNGRRPVVLCVLAVLLAGLMLCLLTSRCRGRAAEARRLEASLERLEEERSRLERECLELEQGNK